MRESSSQSEPTEKERKEVEERLKEESKWLTFDTFSALPEEEKKKKVTERWSKEKGKAKMKGIPWRMLEPKIENVPKVAAMLAGVANKMLMSGIRNGGVSSKVLGHEASATAHRMESARTALRMKARQKTIQPLSPLRSDSIPNQAEETFFDEDTELPPVYTYTAHDDVTLPPIENTEKGNTHTEIIGALVNEYAEESAAQYREEDPELAGSIEAFYAEVNTMLERNDVDAALRFLDSNLGGGKTNVWDSELRNIALQLGEMKREQYENPKVDFDDITFFLSKNASESMESVDREDIETYALLMTLLEQIQDPTEKGTQALREALEYSERILAFRTGRLNEILHVCDAEQQGEKATIYRDKAEGYRAQVEEVQRMRDAVLTELELRSEQTESNTEETSYGETSDTSTPEQSPANFDELLGNPNLELSDAERETMRMVIERLENDVLQGGEGEMYWEKEMLEQLVMQLQEGTPDAVERVDTILGGYVRRTIFQKIKNTINRTDIVVTFDDKKQLLDLSSLSEKILLRNGGGRVHDIRGVEDQVDALLEKYEMEG